MLAGVLVVTAASGALTSGCDAFLGSTKVGHAQLYQSDDPRFDPYFDSVHQQQVAAAAWPDEKKAARKPLVAVLTLPPNANDDQIIGATRERAKKLEGGGGRLDVASAKVTAIGTADGPLFAAVEDSVRLELDRARKRRAQQEKLEELARHGEELKRTADREWENRGAEKADQKKSDKRLELRRELGASIKAMRALASDASKDAQDGQVFLEDIGDAIEAKDAPPRGAKRTPKPLPPPAPPPPPKAEEPPPPAKPAKPARPEKKPAPPPAARPAEAPPPKPKPPEDVFTP
ncbi:MAG: hypothetical protein JWP97_6795 [Labilithrix sp.]|nr:hypothetical protein [Labilithrix sp.]